MHSTILITSSNKSEFDLKATTAFSLVNEWLNTNFLRINLSKTHFMQFTRSNKHKSYLPTTHLNKQIKSVSNTKFLGIYINETFNWKNHIDHILPKLSVACHAMRIIKPYMSLETLRMVYHSTFHSVISYCLPFCGTSPQSKRVFLMQKRIIRIVLGRTRLASCRTLFKHLKILPLMSQYIFSIMMLIIKQNIILQLIQQFII